MGVAQDLLAGQLTVKTEDNRRIIISSEDVLQVVMEQDDQAKKTSK